MAALARQGPKAAQLGKQTAAMTVASRKLSTTSQQVQIPPHSRYRYHLTAGTDTTSQQVHIPPYSRYRYHFTAGTDTTIFTIISDPLVKTNIHQDYTHRVVPYFLHL